MFTGIWATEQDDLRCRWFWVGWVSAPGAWRESGVFRIVHPDTTCITFCLVLTHPDPLQMASSKQPPPDGVGAIRCVPIIIFLPLGPIFLPDTHWLDPREGCALLALLLTSLPPSSKLLGAFKGSLEVGLLVSPYFLHLQPSLGAPFHCVMVPASLRAHQRTCCCGLRHRVLWQKSIFHYSLFIQIRYT